MKRILLSAVIINLFFISVFLSCFFETERDSLNDPKSDNYNAKIYMFPSSLEQGNMRGTTTGREGANELCGMAHALLGDYNLPDANVYAFISVSADDEVRDMPLLYGVPEDRQIVGIEGVKIADNWADILDGSIDNSLYDALGITYPPWFATYIDGSFNGTANCSNWESNSDSSQGSCGDPDSVTESWILGDLPYCDEYRPVLCICWE